MAIAPLQYSVPIVNEDGTPTGFFLDQWNNQIANNLTVDGNAANIETLDQLITAFQQTSFTGDANINVSGSVGGEVTFALTETGVSADTYGSGTQVAQITVDAFGRITSVTNVDITAGGGGGGGSNFAWPMIIGNAASSGAFATKGYFFRALREISISQVSAVLTSFASTDFRAGVYRCNSSGEILEVLGVSDEVSPGNTGGDTTVSFDVTATVPANEFCAIVVIRTDDGPTDALSINIDALSTSSINVLRQVPFYPSLPTIPFATGGANQPDARCELASISPTVGQTFTVTVDRFAYTIGITFTH